MDLVFVSGIGIAVFIEFLLITKKRKSAPDRILALWMFLILVHLFLLHLHVTGDMQRAPFLLGLEQPLPLLQGVFLFLYTSVLTNRLPRRRSILFLHFVPAALVYLFLIPFFALPGAEKIAIYRQEGAGYETFMLVKRYAIALSGIVYVVWSALLLRRHRNAIRDRFSDLEKVNLQWLRILTIGMGGIWFLVIFFRSELLVMGGIVVFIFLIGFFGVRQADIFSSGREPEETTEPEETAGQKQKYTKSGLTEAAAERLHASLLRLMADEALYKKSDLSITDLAARLSVHPNSLSQVINQTEGKNFYDFVNTYRIEEFKRLLGRPENRHLTLLALAYDCGFSSKSSFNRYFKKVTGRTPSEYSTSATTAVQDPA